MWRLYQTRKVMLTYGSWKCDTSLQKQVGCVVNVLRLFLLKHLTLLLFKYGLLLWVVFHTWLNSSTWTFDRFFVTLILIRVTRQMLPLLLTRFRICWFINICTIIIILTTAATIATTILTLIIMIFGLLCWIVALS